MTGSPLGSLAPFGGSKFERIENLIVLPSAGSTNEVGRGIAARMLDEDNEILTTAVVTASQVAGRGRSGRKWESPEGSLAVSLLLPWPEGPERVRLPLSVGIPLARHLSATFGVEVRLKWPNDLTVSGRKLGGILIETRHRSDGEGTAVVGIGLNATTPQEAFDRLGLTAATSLVTSGADAAGLAGDAALRKFLEALDAALGEPPEAIDAEFGAVSAHRPGEPIVVHDGPRRIEGAFLGVTPDGFLRLRTGAGDEVVLSGEVESF